MGIRSFFSNLFGGNRETNAPQTSSASEAAQSCEARRAAFLQSLSVSPERLHHSPSTMPKSASTRQNEGGRDRSDELTHTRDEDYIFGSSTPQDDTANTSTAPSVENCSVVSSPMASNTSSPSDAAPQVEGEMSDAPGPESTELTGSSSPSGEDDNGTDNSDDNAGNDDCGDHSGGNSNDDGDSLS